MLDAGDAELCCVSGFFLFCNYRVPLEGGGGDVLVGLENLAIKPVRQKSTDLHVLFLPGSPCVS